MCHKKYFHLLTIVLGLFVSRPRLVNYQVCLYYKLTRPEELRRMRTGGFSVSFTGSKRRIFGGAVAGALIAASPVEVSVFSFGPAAGLMNLKSVGQTGASTAPSRGMYSGLLSELACQTGANTPPSRDMYSGLLSELSSHPKSKRSGNRKR